MSLPNPKKRKIFDGRYEVISIVGRGIDSVVYHARHLSGAQQEVALKVLVNNKPKSSMTERLRKEALTLVSCRHKYVVRLDDFHSVADLCYLSMEYAALGDLRKYITAQGTPLSPELGAEFLRHHDVIRQVNRAIGAIRGIEDFLRGAGQVMLAQRLADIDALGGEEGEDHAAADEHLVALLDKGFYYWDFCRNFSAANYRCERFHRFVYRPFEEFDFLFK
jgi:hypothetical protein